MAGSQNFDPEWAQHLKHNPDKPLGESAPALQITWPQCWSVLAATRGQEEAPQNHDETRRVTVKGQQHGQISRTMITVTVKISGTQDSVTIPCETGATVGELAERLAFKLARNPEDLSFTQKSGPYIKHMYPHEQVARAMIVKGISSFKRAPMTYAHPKAIIGAGHLGLRMALFLVERKQTDFVVFDRMGKVGGTSWMYQANSTSKLQTEYGAYHLAYGEKYSIPTYFTTPWPSRNALLNMFEKDVEQYGVLPYCKLNTNVKSVKVVSHEKAVADKLPVALRTEKYDLVLETMESGRLRYGKLVAADETNAGEETEFSAASICMFPGNLTLPRMETYKGEDVFGGDIGYAMFNEIDYHKLEGLNVTIIGHGAFAVENIRTCCEFGVHQMYLVCRRKNLSCPRVASWMANRSMIPLSNPRYMKTTEPMYKLAGLDPWSFYAVQANEKRTTCQLTQKARFGIGDIYFLSIYMGKVEVVVDPNGVKRVSRHEVHLHNGRKLHCNAILKLLGLIGEMENDRLLKIKELVGFWVNEDPRRYMVAEPVSVMCSQMGGTSFSPGAYSWSMHGLYFIDYPTDFTNGPLASGMLPRHGVDMSDEGTPRPAHVVDARHGTTTSMAVGMFTPPLMELESTSGFIKAVRHRLCHPTVKFLAQAKEDWDYYAQRMLAEGFGTDKPYPDYPYTPQLVKEMYTEHVRESGEPVLPCDAEDLSQIDALA